MGTSSRSGVSDHHRGGAASSRAVAVVIVLALATAIVTPPPAGALEGFTMVARADGRAMDAMNENNPLRLNPRRPLHLEVRLTNSTAQPVRVQTIRLAGKVLSLNFFGYETTVAIDVAPGTTVSRQFSLDLAALDGQATGLIPTRLGLLDPQRNELTSQRLVADVRGSLRSAYGIFGIAVAMLTALSLAGALFALVRHRLPANRAHRGLRFLPTGVGLGLTLVFTLSALRVFVPRADRWAPILLIAAGALFAVGYFTPTPDYPGVDPDRYGTIQEPPPDDGLTTRPAVRQR